MRTARGLFRQLHDPNTLRTAFDETVRGKRRRSDVAWALFNREDGLERLRCSLANGSWRPEGFDLLRIRDPKPRIIARAPIWDRVVHTAVVRALEPSLTRTLLPSCMACRSGLGTHRAVLRLYALQRRHPWFVHLDVRAYFPSIDLDMLRSLLARRVRDPRFVGVVDRILDSGRGLYADPDVRAWARLTDDWPPLGRGLPIGAYTSQVFAAWLYLDGLDHFVKRQLKAPGYVRYVDDLFVFGPSRRAVGRWRGAIGAWLEQQRGLRLKHPRARVRSCLGTLDGLGHRIRREGIDARPRVSRRLRSRVATAMWRPGAVTVDLRASVQASAGVLTFG